LSPFGRPAWTRSTDMTVFLIIVAAFFTVSIVYGIWRYATRTLPGDTEADTNRR
jgi:hypothetical protein